MEQEYMGDSTTSEIHPLDQDIILDSKLGYQKLLLQILLFAERNTVVKGYRNAGFPTDCFESS
ncbi:hypothetical protein T06_51 [Trichinella sp. T6]|nr:hypothetical protein T06_51 [Trichinella sp. T6]